MVIVNCVVIIYNIMEVVVIVVAFSFTVGFVNVLMYVCMLVCRLWL